MELILTPEAEAFVEEWVSPSRYIVARTSGSTGQPKEILLSKEDMSASARATNKFFGIDSFSTLLLPLAPSYIAGKMQIVRALTAGCKLITEKSSNRPFPHFSGKATMIPVVPSQLESLIETGLYRKVDNIIIGGSPLSPEMETRLFGLGARAWVTYGMTETCSHVALRKIGSDKYEALPGFEFSTDAEQCLRISSTTLSFGSLQTNDIVEICGTKSFKWLGRRDNVINSGGIKIFPEEIEKELSRMVKPETEFYVTSRRSLQWGEEAVIITTAEENAFPASILSEYNSIKGKSLIKDLIRTDYIERTSSGKIIRRRR
ncbi:MAG: AMP-binding protein [Duncaniella sp.]|nr:AMP-binding protein [Duncaniella sp.]